MVKKKLEKNGSEYSTKIGEQKASRDIYTAGRDIHVHQDKKQKSNLKLAPKTVSPKVKNQGKVYY